MEWKNLQIKKIYEMRAKIESQFHSRKAWPAVKPFRVSPDFPSNGGMCSGGRRNFPILFCFF
jgi:hypothetical protein